MTETDEAPQALFWNPRNISYGDGPNAARVLYAPRLLTTSGDELPAGWVLPGGTRTTDAQHAQRVAAAIYGWGLHISTRPKSAPHYDERNGLSRAYYFAGLRFEWLKP